MKISKLIEQLETSKETMGDLDVCYDDAGLHYDVAAVELVEKQIQISRADKTPAQLTYILLV